MACAFIRLSHCARRSFFRPAAPFLRLKTRPLRHRRRHLASLMDQNPPEISYLNQQAAVALDEALMGPLSFSVDQLMELAGLSVASAIQSEYSVSRFPRVLVIAGPGNNGGDGLVAARHLTHFGHSVEIAYPKPTNKILYNNLLTQCENLAIPMCRPDVFQGQGLQERYDLIVDAIFGFSFKGEPRPPFDKILDALKPERNPPKIISVDIPSGWNVEKGDEQGTGIRPEMLVSLSAPKQCAKFFTGAHHYLGGRFLPPSLIEKFQLQLPPYQGSHQCVKLNPNSASELQSMRTNYESSGLDEGEMHQDPFEQFKIWLEAYTQLNITPEPNATVLATCGDDGVPSARCILLKGLDHNGFVFYTNYESKKGNQLKENAHAALCFYMEPLKRQVRVEGVVHRLSEESSEEYFSTRPRASQLSAWASAQSSIVSSRQEIENRLTEVQHRFADASVPIPKPPYWGGFVIVPRSIEFWQGRAARLHDRVEYVRDSVDAPWTLQRLSP